MTQLPTPGLGERIARSRKLNGWSAERLATEAGAGLTRAIVANVESGRRTDLSLSQFMAICIALQVPPAALLVDLEHPTDEIDFDLGNEQATNWTGSRWLLGEHIPSIDLDAALPSAQRWHELREVLALALMPAADLSGLLTRIAAESPDDAVAQQRAERAHELQRLGLEKVRQRLSDLGIEL